MPALTLLETLARVTPVDEPFTDADVSLANGRVLGCLVGVPLDDLPSYAASTNLARVMGVAAADTGMPLVVHSADAAVSPDAASFLLFIALFINAREEAKRKKRREQEQEEA